jgi:cell division protein FtsI/penicillin-binding protein 2
VIVKSSNVGAIKIALKIGPEKFSEYVQKFGFGDRARPTSAVRIGHRLGTVEADPTARSHRSRWATQVGVTPLQMAAAVSAVANGGELLQPRAVRAVIRDGKRLPVPRKVLDRAISTGTAATLTEIMEDVVSRARGRKRRFPGFTVAGKTGTAKKLVNGSYRGHSDYNVSFVGFVPSRKPVFAIVVVVDSPHRVSPYGGVVAAPIFQKIASAALRHHGIPQTIDAPAPLLVTRSPSRVAADVRTGRRLLRS